MFSEFYHQIRNKVYWQPNEKILLAISGGVDSMVLLKLMQKVAKKDQLQLAVVHVNHQLRKESNHEAAYLFDYCKTHKIPYFYKIWKNEKKHINTEMRARQFRYNFFSEIMKKHAYTILLTAHHKDDQAETILMKITRGSLLQNLVGIREKQVFANGYLIRPFLNFSKKQIESFAEKTAVIYFNDETNLSERYARNRMRNKIIPLIKEENPKFLEHIHAFSEQIELASECIQEIIKPNYEQWVKQIEKGWLISLSDLASQSQAMQMFFFQFFFQQTLIPKGIQVNKTQVAQIISTVNNDESQVMIPLEKEWSFIKEYGKAYVLKNTDENKKSNQKTQLALNTSVFLSDEEWLAIESVGHEIEQPMEVMNWKEESILIRGDIPLPLVIRHRKDGDRIALNKTLIKRVNRLFIDKKIPNKQRDNAWLILSAQQEIIWIPQFANSYLSIPAETDKILYRLIYKTNSESFK